MAVAYTMDVPHKDPEARRAYYREFKKSAAKKLSDKYYSAALHANRRAVRYGVEGKITTADARAILDGAACHYCGEVGEWMGLDHVKALAKGGPNHPSNIVAACHSCNVKKARKDRVDQWTADHDRCITCGLTKFPHSSRGRCTSCAPKEYARLRKLSGSNKSSS